jgi:hypothetical protein
LLRRADFRFALALGALVLSLSVARADCGKEMAKLATALASYKKMAGKRVVVFNIISGEHGATRLSVDLAVDLGTKLFEAAKGKFTVIERTAGESLWMAERAYTVREESLAKTLENFRADVGVLGEYSLQGNLLRLSRVRALAVPTVDNPPEKVASAWEVTAKLDSFDCRCMALKDRPLPPRPDTLTEFFLNGGADRKLIAARQLVDTNGSPLTANCARIGSYYRLRVDLSERAYLYVISFDEDNNQAYLLYPLQDTVRPPDKKGASLFPDLESRLAYQAKAPAGRNYVRIFACESPLPFKYPLPPDYTFMPEELKSFVLALRKLPKEEWSATSIFASIIE